MAGCGKGESTAASNQGAVSGKLSPQAEAREKDRVANLAKQYDRHRPVNRAHRVKNRMRRAYSPWLHETGQSGRNISPLTGNRPGNTI